MPATFRVLTAAFVVALASLGGALYLSHERDLRASGNLGLNAGSVATLDLNSLLNHPHESDEALLGTAFHRVEDTYYKPVTAQLLLDGERRDLLVLLHSRNVHNRIDPGLKRRPAIRSTTRRCSTERSSAPRRTTAKPSVTCR